MNHVTLSRRTALRGAVVVGVSAATGLLSARPAAAAVTSPTIAGCDTWGARPPSSPLSILTNRPNKILVHHTASANTSDMSLAHAYANARQIQDWHMDGNGWFDSGQQFTISRGGYVTEGRHNSLSTLRAGSGMVLGAHCPGQNDQSIGIENEGLYNTASPPAALYDKLVTFCAYVCQQYAIPATQIYGHRDFLATECPGNALYAMLPALRFDVATKLGTGGRSWPILRLGNSGEPVRTVQYLLRQAGYAATVDGTFTTGTETLVKNFQSARGLTADGVVGNLTWDKLVVLIRQGSTGEAVKAAQSQLNLRGYGLVVDGDFAAATAAAVRNFQSGNSLTVDGVIGADTWYWLV